ncbi:hypothetical protein SDC9_103806 [bioreactor metagenome]|uniref:HEAT repeat domain-containing protein n=1 Tax=bioreactor metagenome TaxID=1076179 RepID=A0A645AV68_9ZZZZ
MKRRFLLLILCFAMFLTSVGAASGPPDTEEALMAQLADMPMEELLKTAEEVSAKAGEPEAMISYASAIAYRLDELPDEQVLSLAANKEKPEYFREIMLELCDLMKSDGNLKDLSVLEDIFSDKSDNEAVRIKAGYLIENPKLLEEIVWQDDGNVAYQALKALRFVDSDCALKRQIQFLKTTIVFLS